MSTTQELLQQYAGRLLPLSFSPGFVCLSYAISLVGTGSTLELMRRRTSHRGLHNLMLLAGAAISMGGIAIWSMHFIGNRAIYILDGREDVQISYSTGMTILSLLVPIFVLLLAYLAVSVNGRIRWWRIGLAGLLSGGAICGMHYLADASISNYQTSYQVGYVVGAALIAVSASTAALALFFVFETAWKVVWWKRIGCAMVLAGAVSGMHWCAAVGTSYRLLHVHVVNQGMSRRETLIMVICLSVAACVVLTISAIYSSWIRRDYASKSQQVVLAAAVFDEHGRIMVNQEGFLPSEVVTDTFIPRSHNEVFDTTHSLFQWMYRASRNWGSIATLTDKMTSHISHLAQDRHNSRARVKLVEEDGSLVPDYDGLICELFSLAALALASRMKDTLINAGTLWEEIFVTGNNSGRAASSPLDRTIPGRSSSPKDMYGRGCLMLLIRHVNSRRDLDRLEAAGYRFAEVHQVVGVIQSSMQIISLNFASRLHSMSADGNRGATLPAGVHLGIFAIRARLDHCGFDVLVQKEAKNLLPATALPFQRLEPWQAEFIGRFRGLTPTAIATWLDKDEGLSPRQARLACHLRAAMATLRESLGEMAFGEATLMSQVVQAPCTTRPDSQLSTCSLITFRMVLPIHTIARVPQCEFIPLSFFRVQQLVYRNSPHHVEFSHMVHRELSSILHNVPSALTHKSQGRPPSSRTRAWMQRFRVDRGQGPDVSLQLAARSQEQLSTTLGSSSPGTPCAKMSFDEYRKSRSDSISSPASRMSPTPTIDTHGHDNKQLFGGIMVSQQIMVDVQELPDNEASPRIPHGEHVKNDTESLKRDGKEGSAFSTIAVGESSATMAREQGGSAFIDQLLALCLERPGT
ncbi:uncharacterized protein HRG_11789 [Hirsutella rhossiliensis]|uniref:MHYT domain-containing protein n=1 Tax=Hirsutella rhossiliensis TaxID=111463 RepID=A0A9P8MLH0_9HYPO|nr:uncharacterized protein HRG_11789 [Hirsutella rhossiliensis]KAH0957240.1 hypothetical protein HRG_11789 [Hirsutella rhossiliensis]